MSKKIWKRLAASVTGLLLFAVSLVGFGALWGLTTWGDIDIDEIIFQLQMPLEGTGNGMLEDYAVKGILPAVLLLILYILVVLRLRDAKKRRIFLVLCLACTLAGAVAVKTYVWERLHVEEWLRGQKEQSRFIEENYVNTADVTLTFPEKKRNLVYIYLESMEVTYADRESGGAFEENTIPELTRLAMDNEDFSGDSPALNGGLVYVGTGFTTGAMFAQSTGLPLKLSIGGNNMDTQDSFFPGIKGLGDILEEEGYRQILMLGSNANFGGRRLLYEEHGNFEIMDYPYAKQAGWIPQDYKVFWGFEDEKLFAFAKQQLQELAAGDAPFNLTLLTIDTHFEDGFVCRLCDDRFGDNQYANVMACSSRQVAAFIEWLQDQDFYENTTVVVAGDHTTMDKDFLEGIDKSYRRRAYAAYINPAVSPADPHARRTYSTMDAFPTTLAAMGVQIDGEKLGLGTNVFSGVQTLSEQYGDDFVRREMGKKSAFLEYLEKTDSSDALLERCRRDLKNALKIDECDFDGGLVRIRVRNAFNSGIKADAFEAEYQEEGTDRVDKVSLEQDPEDREWFTGTLDISGWKKPAGEIRINVRIKDNKEFFENVVSAQLGEE